MLEAERLGGLPGKKQAWVSGAASDIDPSKTGQVLHQRQGLFRRPAANRIDDVNHRWAGMKPSEQIGRARRKQGASRACLYGQVINIRRNDRIIKVDRRAVIGAAWRAVRERILFVINFIHITVV